MVIDAELFAPAIKEIEPGDPNNRVPCETVNATVSKPPAANEASLKVMASPLADEKVKAVFSLTVSLAGALTVGGELAAGVTAVLGEAERQSRSSRDWTSAIGRERTGRWRRFLNVLTHDFWKSRRPLIRSCWNSLIENMPIRPSRYVRKLRNVGLASAHHCRSRSELKARPGLIWPGLFSPGLFSR
jgi:hypothetical protein